jgi:BirA family biotin operon repressor/biotin-[acetyl-CoA-carboxylase] ligase
MIDGKKICGILQEVVYRKDKKFLVIGIGINVVKNPLIFDYPTTNLCEITGKSYNKNNVEKLLIFNFENKFRKFFKK